MKFYLLFIIVFSTSLATGCGVHVSSDDSTSTDVPYNNAAYSIFLTDDRGYIEETLASGCIDLDYDSREEIEIEEYTDYGYDSLFYTWEVDGSYLVVELDQEGERLHKSFYRTSYFSSGYEVEESVISDGGNRYDLVLTGQGCL